MKKVRSTYPVHAEIQRLGDPAEAFDDAKAGHPLERRLNRVERIAMSYRGKIDLRFKNGMLMTFDTADAALLGACEMQNRCVVLPQVSRQKLALRIGIHRGLVRQRSRDDADNAREIALHLATKDDGIVASDAVVADLNPDLRKIARPLDDGLVDIKAFQVDWRSEIPSSAFGGESFWPASVDPHPKGPIILLHHGVKTLEATQENPTLTIGRDPFCDLVLVDQFASRLHCRIERRADCVVLTDLSTNGTCVRSDDGVEHLIKKASWLLSGKGLLFFGRQFNGERRGGVRYETY